MYALPDAGTRVVLKFFAVLFRILGKMFPPLCFISRRFPTSTYHLQSSYGALKKFHRFVVCRKCDSVYNYEDCKERNSSKRCSFVSFPNHPHLRMRTNCNSLLLKTVELSSGKHLLYPYLTYCYVSIKDSLGKLLVRESFLLDCEAWRSRTLSQNKLSDIYDGDIWREFQSINGTPFLSQRHCLGLMINLDWFRPFKHSEYSIGAIYITVMNLPRHLRNKPENVLLVGILPGPSEATNLNGFLKPLVNELNEFWEGILLNIYGSSTKELIRCALLCASCDLPAGRKLCGFLSYNAHQGCSRCHKSFSQGYGGFERDKWVKRTRTEHLEITKKLEVCNTKKEVREIESKSGYRYTELLKLPYFNPSRMLAVDPMHNLFLGSAKRILKKVWIDKGIIPEAKFDLIQNRIDKVVVPPDIGRIPLKIRSGFSAFTADQFKNWILYYSVLVLRDIVVGNDLQCWCHFVLACSILCQHQITNEQLQLADALLLQFCKRCERMYGPEVITPNMHMHAHLSECIQDFGPVHVFWLFSFERYNGILEHLPNNNRSIEIQILKRFMESTDLLSLPKEHHDEFDSIFRSQKLVGTLSQCAATNTECTYTQDQHHLPKFYQQSVMTKEELEQLKKLYSHLLEVPTTNINAQCSYRKYQYVHINGKLFGSMNSRSSSSSIIMAERHPTTEIRAAQVKFFAQHNVVVEDQNISFLLFYPLWFKRHQQHNLYPKPVTMWEPDCFELSEEYHHLPVQFIRARTASLIDTCALSNTCNESVLLISSIIE